ncbi:MAG: aminotransferase class I/II-fold pyridoxal phosphate-dependent enzyme [Clostridia bacterium]|nr:aminotransferase class I/II-fold pyridoxal phosphate-dependent enzyme [Clostridia bacterium]
MAENKFMEGNQLKVPLAEAMFKYVSKNPARFHMPGHKGKKPFKYETEIFNDIWQADLTETEGLDILAAPQGVIEEAQKACAELCRASEAYFLVNGATVGLQACIMAACEEKGSEIIVPRNAHRSVWGAIAMADAKPVWLPVYQDARYGIALGVDADTVNQTVLAHPNAKAVVYVYPTYHGLCNDLKAMLRTAAEHSMYTIVDEAHGGHFVFTGWPESAIDGGAAAVIQGWHKTMGSLTQTGVLLLNDTSLPVAKYLSILQSSSPSYPLMASLDMARAGWQAKGYELASRILENATAMRVALSEVDIFQVLGAGDWPWPVADYDNSRVVIVSRAGHSGRQIAEVLAAQGIYAEMADAATVTFIVSFNDNQAEIAALKPKLQAAGKVLATLEPKLIPQIQSFPFGEMVMLPSEALRAAAETVPLKQAAGRVASDLVVPYPPGIPIVGFGEIISAEIVETIYRILVEGGRVQGLTEGNVSVVK